MPVTTATSRARRIDPADGVRLLATLSTFLTASAAAALAPETDPARIARDQRRAVAEAAGRLGPSPSAEDVSGVVCLPVEVVRRRLAELRLAPEVV